MGMDKGSLLKLHKELLQALRVNYYPPCHKPDKMLGISPHSDTSTITILMQDDDVTGLQIRHQEGWVPVEPVPNALVVNIGDVIEVLHDRPSFTDQSDSVIKDRVMKNNKHHEKTVLCYIMKLKYNFIGVKKARKGQ